MKIVIDCETQGLNARKFLLGVICYENEKTEVYKNPKKMLNRIMELGKQCKAQGENLIIYAHHLEYDFIAIGAWEMKENIIFCSNPFIVDTYGTSKRGETVSYIKWVCTMGFWRGSLAGLGEAIGYEKGETPEWLYKDEHEPSFMELNKATTYCIRDCQVLMRFLTQLRKKLWAEGIRPKKLITTPQVAITYLLSRIRKQDTVELEVYNSEKGRRVKQGKYLNDIDGMSFYRTEFSDEILEAYRAGRIEAFQTGKLKEAELDDLNSLYPYAATQVEYPKLDTERKIYTPLVYIGAAELFKEYGVSHCIVETPRQKEGIGYLPIRQYKKNEETGNRSEYTYYPISDESGRKLLLGSWTHLELRRAIELGYSVKHIFWTITWETITSPLPNVFKELYRLRKESENEHGRSLRSLSGSTSSNFDQVFYKLIMNSMIGKLAQRRPHKLVTKIDMEELPSYTADGWEAIHTYGTEVIVHKNQGIDYKRYYAPIIATYITAWSRDHLYNYLSVIPREQLWYCDTDSIVYDSVYWNSSKEKTTKFKYGEDLGEWKKEHHQAPLHVYGRKAYSIGEEIKLSRVPKKGLTKTAFDAGSVFYTDIIKLKQTTDPTEAGKPIKRERKLAYQEEEKLDRVLIDTRTTLTETHFKQLDKLTKKF